MPIHPWFAYGPLSAGGALGGAPQRRSTRWVVERLRLQIEAAIAAPGRQALERAAADHVTGEHACVALTLEHDDVAVTVAQLPQPEAGDHVLAGVGGRVERVAGDDRVRNAVVHVLVEDGVGPTAVEAV